jgi:hemerythrin-like metal-binding protein
MNERATIVFSRDITSSTELIVWSQDLETGIAEIDFQHRNLVDTFNRAGAELGDDSNEVVWERFTYELLSYALYHFSTEEKLATQHAYDQENEEEAQAHQAQHRYYTKQLTAIREQLRLGVLVEKARFLDFLRNWLIEHILHTDQQLATFIHDKARQNN